MVRILTSLALVVVPSALVRAEPTASRSEEPLQAEAYKNAGTAEDAEYQRVVAAGVAEHEAGRWAEARALFRRAHALKPSARTYRVLGMTAFELREYAEAVREFTGALEDPRSPLDVSHREQVQELLDLANTFVGRYTLEVEPEDARLEVDGVEASPESDGTLLLTLGRHELRFEAPDHVAEQRVLHVKGKDRGVLHITLAPAGATPSSASRPPRAQATPLPSPSPKDWQNSSGTAFKLRDYAWTLGTAGASLALGGAALALHRRALDNQQALEQRCMSSCYPEDDVTAKRDALRRWSRISLGVSAALATSVLVLALVEGHKARAQNARSRRARAALRWTELSVVF